MNRDQYLKIQAIMNAKAGRTLPIADVKVADVSFIPV